jgi:hypothetical protein
MSAVLGICHAPGYAIEVAFGRLFSLLPFGAGVAWRVNLLMAVSGVVGCLALHGAVHRVTGRPLAGALAGAILGFSSIYWSYSIAAEAYVFHGAFLLVAVYALVRFEASDRERWLYVAALALGTCVAGRPSELTLLPAFAVVLYCFRARVTLDARRIAGAASLLLLPFVLSVGFHLLRPYPKYMPTREPILASEILTGKPYELARGTQRLREVVRYGLGIGWSGMIQQKPVSQRLAEGVPRYLELLVGGSLLSGSRSRPTPYELEHGVGMSIGLTGLALAALGASFHWRSRWPLLGLGLFAGNAAFYLWYQTYEALTYTVPGLAGLAFLAGLGIAGPPGDAGPRELRVLGAVGALTVATLLLGNYRVVDRSASVEPLGRPHMSAAQARALPRQSHLLMDHWHAATYRYVLHLEAGRTDVQVIGTGLDEVAQWDRIVAYLVERGYPTLVHEVDGRILDSRAVSEYRERTPAALARFGFFLVHDSSVVPRRSAPGRRGLGPR